MGPVSVDASWVVCHTRPRCEKKFAELLTAERLDHYLPLVSSQLNYGARVRAFTKPLFPSYVFAKPPEELRTRLFQRDFLVRIIPVDDQELFLKQLDDVRAVVASGFQLSLHPIIKRGTRVRIVGGALNGLEGTIDDPKNPKGIILSVDILQQGLHVKVPLDRLRPLT